MNQHKFNPCIDYCYIRYGRQYEPGECEKRCEFASVYAEKRALEQKLEAYRREPNLLQKREDAANV